MTILTGIRQISVNGTNIDTKPTCAVEGFTVVTEPELSQNGTLFDKESAAFCTLKLAVYVPGEVDPTGWQNSWRAVPVVVDLGNGAQLVSPSAKINGKPSVNHEDGTVDIEFYMKNVNYIPGQLS